MENGKDNKWKPSELFDTIYFVLLPLLCIVSIMRGCSVRSAEIPQAAQQTASEKQYVTSEAEGTYTGEKTEEPAEAVQESEAVINPEATAETSESDEKEVTVRSNPYNPNNFSYVDEVSDNITYHDENYECLQGIDVSDHQAEIDWKMVADAGYDFVFVRVGYRGYGDEGTLNEDTMAVEYMQEAEKAGLEVGAYFFSQAISEEEAAEEARFAAEIIKRSGVTMALPLVYDPELIEGAQGRADHISREQVSANARAFKKAAEELLKCKTAIYTNLYWENNYFDKEVLNEFEIWYADYEETPQTPYHFTWWQYSETGSVPGIKGAMDLNLWIRRVD